MKKIISIIIGICVLFNATFLFIQANDNVAWMLSSDKTILKIFSDIPNYDAGTAPWYKYSNQIEEVILGDAVSYIGNYAFYNCTELSEINIPDGVAEIGYDAFVNCVALTSIDIPDSVAIIGSSAFEDCENIESIELSENITKIYPFTFTFCKSLEEIEVPGRVEIIEQGAFTNCAGLSKIYLPKSVETIGNRVFYGCSSLDRVVYGGSKDDWNEISIGTGNDVLNNANIIFLDESTDEYETLRCYYCQQDVRENMFFDYNENIICFDCAENVLYEDEEYQEDYYEDEYLTDEYYDIACQYCREVFEENEIWYDSEGYGMCPYCDEYLEGYEKGKLMVSAWYKYDTEYDEYLVYMEASDYGAVIYYTTDRDYPNKQSRVYDEPIYVIGKHMVIRAIAVLDDEQSEVVNVWLTPEGAYENEEYYEEEYYEEEYYEETDVGESVKIELAIGTNLIYINDEPIRIDAEPVIKNDRTMVPIRVIAEALGATVTWKDAMRTVSIKTAGGGYDYWVTIGKSEVVVWSDPEAPDFDIKKATSHKLDSVAFIENDRTYLPVRFVSEMLGAEVTWDNYTQTVTIFK